MVAAIVVVKGGGQQQEEDDEMDQEENGRNHTIKCFAFLDFEEQKVLHNKSH